MLNEPKTKKSIKLVGDFCIFVKNQFIKHYAKVLTICFPAKTVATFFGIGYLPEWQGHWASLLSIAFVALIAYIFAGFEEQSIIEISLPAAITAIIFFFVGFISIYIFQLKVPEADDEIMIHIVFGQIFVLAFSGPAVISAGSYIESLIDGICGKFMYCPPWFHKTMVYVPILSIPYFTYRFMDSFKPWPASILDKDYNSSLSNMAEATVNSFYTLLFLYLCAFIFFGLTLDEALFFFHGLWVVIFPDLQELFIIVMGELNDLGILNFLNLQDYYYDFVRNYYDIPKE